MNVLMPQLGETVSEGKIIKWFKAVGDPVAAGDNLCEVETDKVTVEIPAISGGVLQAINVEAGVVAPVGAVIAVVSDAAAATGPARAASSAAPPASVKAPAASAVQVKAAPAAAARIENAPAIPPRRRFELDPFREVQTPLGNFGPARLATGVAVTPLARRLAADASIDLARVSGSGPAGRITGRDVEKAASLRPAASPSLARAEAFEEMIGEIHRGRPHQIVPAGPGMRARVPQFHLATAVAIDRLARIRDEINAGAPKTAGGSPAWELSGDDFMIKALALALQQVPRANAMWSPESILQFDHSDVAVAVSPASGQRATVVLAAETKSLSTISNEIRAIAAGGSESGARSDDPQGGTTTLYSLGAYGVRDFWPAIVPPQATMLAIGAAERHAVETADEGVAFVGRLTATLACDNRVLDPVLGAELLDAFRDLVENPLRMVA